MLLQIDLDSENIHTFCHGQKRGSFSGLKAAGEEEEEEEILYDAAPAKDLKLKEGLSVEEAITAIDSELQLHPMKTVEDILIDWVVRWWSISVFQLDWRLNYQPKKKKNFQLCVMNFQICLKNTIVIVKCGWKHSWSFNFFLVKNIRELSKVSKISLIF